MQTIEKNLEEYIDKCDDVYESSFRGLLNPSYYKEINDFFESISKAFRRNESDKVFRMGPRNLN